LRCRAAHQRSLLLAALLAHGAAHSLARARGARHERHVHAVLVAHAGSLPLLHAQLRGARRRRISTERSRREKQRLRRPHPLVDVLETLVLFVGVSVHATWALVCGA
jgi:hypothetical protein